MILGTTPAIALLLALAAEPDRVVLTGVVTDARGRPAAGADVLLAEGSRPTLWETRYRDKVSRPPAILGRSRADGEGRFRLELPPRGGPGDWFMRRPTVVWGIGEGGAITVRAIPEGWPHDGADVRLTLTSRPRAWLAIVDPTGRRVWNARVAPARFLGVELPSELSDRLATVTDPTGRARVTDFGDDLEAVRVTSPKHGVQTFAVPVASRTLTLAAVGRVDGRIQAGDSKAVRGVTVRLRTDADASGGLSGVGGSATTVTDEEGRFHVPALAVGSLAISIDPHADLPWRAASIDQRAVVAGAATEVDITLKRAARIMGTVVEKGGGKPVAGAGVILDWNPDLATVLTDAEGRFMTFGLPATLSPFVGLTPRGYYNPDFFLDNQIVPEGSESFTLKPLELARGQTLRGVVVDSDGKPAAGADVSGFWLRPARGYETVGAVADRAGRFTIEGIAAETRVQLAAMLGTAVTKAPESAPPGKDPITLRVSPEFAVALEGRAIEPGGRPVPGASVIIESRKRGPENFPVEPVRTVAIDDDGRVAIRTDSDGRFRSPRRLRPDLEYRAEIEADGHVLGRTEWLDLTKAKAPTLPALTLEPVAPTRTVEGGVVDAGGKPVAGVVIFQSGDGPVRTRTTADADGRFRLPGVFREPAFLFVQGAGLRFEGYRVGPETGPVTLTVRRDADPPGPALKTLSPKLARDEEKALALRLIADDLKRHDPKNLDADIYRVTDIIAGVDPARALEMAEKVSIPDLPEFGDNLRMEIATGLLGESDEEAAAIVESIKKASVRSNFYRTASDAVPASDRRRKVEMLDKALLHTRAETDPSARVEELGLIGYRLLDLGETDRGTKVLQEGQRLAYTLPKYNSLLRRSDGVHARGRFAAKLARIDAAGAFELAEGFGDPYDNWYVGGVALGLADRDPEAAERALAKMPRKEMRAERIVRVVRRMAAKDPERARQLAVTPEDPKTRNRALASLAKGLTANNPKEAERLIDELFDQMLKAAEAGSDNTSAYRNSCLTAADLLPTAERIDPELLRRCLWKTIALRPARAPGGDRDGLVETILSHLATALARYDRDVARQVLEPVARRARSLDDGNLNQTAHSLWAAAAAVDPAWAASLADSLPDDTPGATLRPKALARRAVARVLAKRGDERWKHLNIFSDDDNKDDER
jgi:hypothetical protein